MEKTVFDFVDLDSDDAFLRLGNKFGGVFQNGLLQFKNPIVCGEIFKIDAEAGIWVRKWKLTVLEKVVLRKLPAPEAKEKKITLVYFLNPSIFQLKKEGRRIPIPSNRNNLCFPDDVLLDFSVMPRQAFYLLDISFTEAWIEKQFEEADAIFKDQLHSFLHGNKKDIFLESCSSDDYRTLRELELYITIENSICNLFVRSRIYKLIMSFFTRMFQQADVSSTQPIIHYGPVMEAEKLLLSDWKRLQKMESIAGQVNLSVSSLLRQFHIVFGKSMEEYYILRKMEMARSLLLQGKLSVKEIASHLGYKRASAFIETFTRQYGYPPGTLKTLKKET